MRGFLSKLFKTDKETEDQFIADELEKARNWEKLFKEVLTRGMHGMDVTLELNFHKDAGPNRQINIILVVFYEKKRVTRLCHIIRYDNIRYARISYSWLSDSIRDSYYLFLHDFVYGINTDTQVLDLRTLGKKK